MQGLKGLIESSLGVGRVFLNLERGREISGNAGDAGCATEILCGVEIALDCIGAVGDVSENIVEAGSSDTLHLVRPQLVLDHHVLLHNTVHLDDILIKRSKKYLVFPASS